MPTASAWASGSCVACSSAISAPSPVSVAQTRRVLLAKQLIHQTRLSMTEVALASGFGSVRRFNETFQRLYDRAPATLRRQGSGQSGGEAPPREDGVRRDRPDSPPYDRDPHLGFHAKRAKTGVEGVSPERKARAIGFGDDHGLLTVARSPKPDRLSVTIRFPRLSALPAIIARVRRVFDLTADPDAIAGHLSGDPALAPRVAARPGLRVPGAWDGFELAVRAILGQQISVQAATLLAGRIVREWGDPLPAALAGVVPGVTHVFPGAERMAAADLSVLPTPRARSSAIGTLAAAVAADPTLFEGRGDLGEAIGRLKALPGIGEWTAQYIAMRQLREPDAFPVGDIGLLRAMAGADGQRPTTQALQARAEAWRPWRAYAALHLWTGEVIADPLAQAATPKKTLPKKSSDDRQAA